MDGRIRYVGATTQCLTERLAQHIRNSKRGEKTHKAEWVRLLLRNGVRPEIELVEQSVSLDRECFWIAHYRKLGVDLTNGTDGGDGCIGLSEEARARIGEASKGRIWSPESREKLSQSRKGFKASHETREKIRQLRLGKPGVKHTDETRERIAESKRGIPRSSETRLKLSMSLKGRPTGRTKSQCPAGHAYNEENTRINIRGHKECRVCERVRYRERKKNK